MITVPGGEIGWRRAERIARTETHTATNMGSHEAARATGLAMDKEWGATEDARTRPVHAEADGQVADMDGSFVVGGEALDYPGDPQGSPWNIINCRCVALYRPRIPRAEVPPAAPQIDAAEIARRLATEVATELFDQATLNRYRASAERLRTGAFEKVTADQIILMRWYTGSGFRDLNRALRTGRPSGGRKRQRDAINGALEAVTQKVAGTLWRRISIPNVWDELAFYRKAMEAGRRVRFRAFTSTSKRPLSGFGSDLEFVVEASQGVEVRNISLHPNEDEVLLQAMREFEVMKVDDTTRPPRVHLREMAGRTRSARQKDADLFPPATPHRSRQEDEAHLAEKMQSGDLRPELV